VVAAAVGSIGAVVVDRMVESSSAKMVWKGRQQATMMPTIFVRDLCLASKMLTFDVPVVGGNSFGKGEPKTQTFDAPVVGGDNSRR